MKNIGRLGGGVIVSDKDELKAKIVISIGDKKEQWSAFDLTPFGFIAGLSDEMYGGKVSELQDRIWRLVSNPKFLSALYSRVEADVDEWLRKQLAKRTGIELDEISEAGLARAISKRARINGLEITSLHDPAIIERDLVVFASSALFAYVGWYVERNVETVEQFVEELESRVIDEIEKRVEGLVIHRMAAIEDSVAEWAQKKIERYTGCQITDIRNAEKTKAQVVDWAFDRVRKRLGIKGTENRLKMDKKSITNRAAQRKFYARHGNMKKYVSVKNRGGESGGN